MTSHQGLPRCAGIETENLDGSIYARSCLPMGPSTARRASVQVRMVAEGGFEPPTKGL